ncbi:rhodopsin [Halomicrobium mukohataei]|uniref:Rhodopsin n=1 Tax=Halomicrobium mukohataei TaxID=57705 RepID=A0A847UDF7_9EURY|nr:bacteriorhodopsin [Halomicrobium mukohataei]NLV09414.1 rhodopsin [Halomicrobium mukohataei]
MIEAATLHGFRAGVYVVALMVLLAWYRRVPDDQRAFCRPVLFVVGFAAVATALVAAGVGTVTVGTGEVVVPSVLDDLVAYMLLYAVMARLAGIDGRALGAIVFTPVAQRLGFEVATVTDGPIALLGLVILVGGHLALAAFLLGPIWRRAQAVPEQPRLLHWKARNLLLFIVGMFVVFVLLALFGIFDNFTTLIVQQYMTVLLRVGFAGFLFTNLDAVGAASLRPSTASGATPAD